MKLIREHSNKKIKPGKSTINGRWLFLIPGILAFLIQVSFLLPACIHQTSVTYTDNNYSEENPLKLAHDMIIGVDPSMEGIINADYIDWLPQGGSGITLGGFTPVAGTPLSGADVFQAFLSILSLNQQRILIDTSFKDADIRAMAITLAHEMYHARDGRFSSSIQEEVGAYRYEYEMTVKLNIIDNPDARFNRYFFNYGPEPSYDQLYEARQILQKSGEPVGSIYQRMPIYPPANPYTEWKALFSMVMGLIIGSFK
jgi:hypothetical protein